MPIRILSSGFCFYQMGAWKDAQLNCSTCPLCVALGICGFSIAVSSPLLVSILSGTGITFYVTELCLTRKAHA